MRAVFLSIRVQPPVPSFRHDPQYSALAAEFPAQWQIQDEHSERQIEQLSKPSVDLLRKPPKRDVKFYYLDLVDLRGDR